MLVSMRHFDKWADRKGSSGTIQHQKSSDSFRCSVDIVLVLLFKDFLHPFTILTALPLSLDGAFEALLGTGMSFSMPSLIGLIMLMGIATKNSILLVEYAIVARRGHGGSDFGL